MTVDLEDLLDDYAARSHLKAKAKQRLRRRLEEWLDQAQDDEVSANLVRDFYALLPLLGVREWDLERTPDLEARLGTVARFSAPARRLRARHQASAVTSRGR